MTLELRNLLNRIRWTLLKRFRSQEYYRRLAEQWDGETLEWLLVGESGELIQRATEYLLDLGDVPLSPNSDSHWVTTDFGTRLCWDSFRKLKKLVEDAQYERKCRDRERHEQLLRWLTFLAAAVAAAASMWTALKKK